MSIAIFKCLPLRRFMSFYNTTGRKKIVTSKTICFRWRLLFSAI